MTSPFRGGSGPYGPQTAEERALDLAIIRAAGASARDVPQAEDREVDETLEDSFPASDPPSFNARY